MGNPSLILKDIQGSRDELPHFIPKVRQVEDTCVCEKEEERESYVEKGVGGDSASRRAVERHAIG